MITIASALMTNGCDVIASLPQGSHSPDTRYSILHTLIIPLALDSRLHPLHPDAPPGDFFDFGEGNRDAEEESGEGLVVAFASGGTAEPGRERGGAGQLRGAERTPVVDDG